MLNLQTEWQRHKVKACALQGCKAIICMPKHVFGSVCVYTFATKCVCVCFLGSDRLGLGLGLRILPGIVDRGTAHFC